MKALSRSGQFEWARVRHIRQMERPAYVIVTYAVIFILALIALLPGNKICQAPFR